MPKLSDTMTEGTLVKWHKKVGDQVEIGDIVAEVETDKATMEMEAFDEGVITDILIQEGEKALVGSTLAVLGGDDGMAVPPPLPTVISAAASSPVSSAAPATIPT
ncbi:MAG: biotin/lipoyl-containing protein, partial [Verrucomicrobiales bacterium]